MKRRIAWSLPTGLPQTIRILKKTVNEKILWVVYFFKKQHNILILLGKLTSKKSFRKPLKKVQMLGARGVAPEAYLSGTLKEIRRGQRRR
ncbi:MAG: hypothetical protein A3B70_00870 [Deltaproteobacteria bacterium RIFCSPHIGHO2_02_FULL_40_11]|nr:MAG: hypothetical protein A3B70_00870 [Deltaproteobacteria bacterium RIFCSPHIGHO2_02_FULL_40_11]